MKIGVLWLLTSIAVCAQGIPRVQSPSGIYLGNTSIAQLDQFLGIRYAVPPVDQLRFANPIKAEYTPGKVINATTYGPGCTQLPQWGQYNGLSEDCLTLNIIRPSGISQNASLPVLFWIHGGGNEYGQGMLYNGTALVQHAITTNQPIVYISINYRLGGFGFLRSPDFAAAGALNLGLKDQYLALQWARENIKSFGGDPDKITIFGESAGAGNCWAQLHYAYTQNEANKYFRGMITESGAPGSVAFPRALVPQNQEALPWGNYAELLAKTNCIGEGIQCLRQVPHSVLAPLLAGEFLIDYALDDEWFDASPTSLVESGQFAALPIIHGTNLDEGSAFLGDVFDIPNKETLIKTIASYLANNTQHAQQLWEAYDALPDAQLGKGFKADPTATHDYWVAVSIYTDLYMDVGRKTWLNIASEKADVWGYEFRQQPPLKAVNLSYEYPGATPPFAERLGVYHGAELPYVFGEITNLQDRTQGDDEVAISIMDSWISFAYYLNPNRRAHDAPMWPTYNSSDVGQLMIFEDQGGLPIRVGQDNMRPSVYQLWSSALSALGENPPF